MPEKEDQLDQIISAISAIGNLDFSKTVPLKGTSPDLDAIAAAVNMLSEELKYKQVTFHEREQLIREVHHRLKNNMQIVSSLMRLQVEHSNGTYGDKELQECLSRIGSMALVHEALYNSDQLDALEINQYISSLLRHISDLQSDNSANIRFNGLGKALHLGSQKSILIGLILHEIINNAFKHSEASSAVEVTLNQISDALQISITDHGEGFASTEEFYHPEGFGLQLVQSFTEQLDGKIELTRTDSSGSQIVLELNV